MRCNIKKRLTAVKKMFTRKTAFADAIFDKVNLRHEPIRPSPNKALIKYQESRPWDVELHCKPHWAALICEDKKLSKGYNGVFNRHYPSPTPSKAYLTNLHLVTPGANFVI